jgi:hypothetical protein
MGRMGGRWRALVRVWIIVTALPLLGITFGILLEPGFPLGLGVVQTRGLTGLWVSLLPAVVGIVGVVVLSWSSRVGAGLILVYSAFWALLLAGMLPVVWNVQSSFCLRGLGVCITGAWLGRLVVLGLLAAFVLVSGWCLRRVRTAGEASGGVATS